MSQLCQKEEEERYKSLDATNSKMSVVAAWAWPDFPGRRGHRRMDEDSPLWGESRGGGLDPGPTDTLRAFKKLCSKRLTSGHSLHPIRASQSSKHHTHFCVSDIRGILVVRETVATFHS